MTITDDYELFGRRYHARNERATRSEKVPTDEEILGFMDAMRTKMMGYPVKKDSTHAFNLAAVHYMYPLCCGNDYHTWIEDAQGNLSTTAYLRSPIPYGMSTIAGASSVANGTSCTRKWLGRRAARGQGRDEGNETAGGTAHALWAFRKKKSHITAQRTACAS